MTLTSRDSVPFGKTITGRKLEDLSANELRMKLYNAGVDYPEDASKKELAELVRKHRI